MGLEMLAEAVKQTQPRSDLPALARGQLENILAAASAALERETDESTALHLKDLVARIEQILEGRFPGAAEPAAAQASRFGQVQEDD